MKKRKRIVLGEGHPWFCSSDGVYDAIQLTKNRVAQSILLRGDEKTVPLELGNLGNWNRIRLIAEVIE